MLNFARAKTIIVDKLGYPSMLAHYPILINRNDVGRMPYLN